MAAASQKQDTESGDQSVWHALDAEEALSRLDVSTAGLDAEEGQDLWEADLARPLALVVGGEGKGMRRLTRDLCDLRVKAPMRGRVRSLNAAVAAGVVLYEVLRQRRLGPGAQTGAVMEEDTPL